MVTTCKGWRHHLLGGLLVNLSEWCDSIADARATDKLVYHKFLLDPSQYMSNVMHRCAKKEYWRLSSKETAHPSTKSRRAKKGKFPHPEFHHGTREVVERDSRYKMQRQSINPAMRAWQPTDVESIVERLRLSESEQAVLAALQLHIAEVDRREQEQPRRCRRKRSKYWISERKFAKTFNMSREKAKRVLNDFRSLFTRDYERDGKVMPRYMRQRDSEVNEASSLPATAGSPVDVTEPCVESPVLAVEEVKLDSKVLIDSVQTEVQPPKFMTFDIGSIGIVETRQACN